MSNPYQKAKRGQGLKQSPHIGGAPKSLPVETSDAVPVSAAPRTYRISTLIHIEAGHNLEELQLRLNRREGRRIKLAEILERAIASLNKTIENV